MDPSSSSALSYSNGMPRGNHYPEIEDPKEKKRLQNRNAQRIYRQRMKARLRDLETIVNERKAGAVHNTQLHPNKSQGPAVQKLPETRNVQPQGMRLGFLENTVDESDQVGYMQFPQPTDNTQSQQTTQTQPPGAEWPERNDRTSDNLLAQDRRSFKGLEYQSSNQPSIHDDAQRGGARMVTRNTNTNWADLSNRAPQQPTPDYTDIIDLNYPMAGWTDDVLPQNRRGPQSSGRVDIPSTPYLPAAPRPEGPSTDRSSSTPPPSQHTAKDGGLSEKFEFMLECTQAVGSENFDSLVIAYYTEKFGASTPLANEQRLSRNRGLPKMISELYLAATGWSDWERRGFHDEILKTTELILKSEAERARDSLKLGLAPLLAAQHEGTNEATDTQSVVNMKKMIEDDLPNLWALLMALSAEDNDVWQRNRSNTVLASVFVLRYAGRIPNEQLLSVLGAFL